MTPESDLRPQLLEALEDRLLLAGNVDLGVEAGFLEIVGDAADNAIVIDQVGLPAGSVRVTGLGTTLTLLGVPTANPAILTGMTRGLGVDMGTGIDSVTVDGVAVRGVLDIESAGDLTATVTGGSANALNVTNGPGVLTATITSTAVRGAVLIDSGDGDTAIAIDDGAAMGSLLTELGVGVNDVTVGLATVRGATTLEFGDGTNTFTFAGSSMGAIRTLAEALVGSATFDFNAGTILRGTTTITGADVPVTVNLNAGATVNGLFNMQFAGTAAEPITGPGSLNVDGATINRGLTALMGVGDDTFTITGATGRGTMRLTLGAGANVVTVNASSLAAMTITGGDAVDTVDVVDTAMTGALNVNGLGGNDTIGVSGGTLAGVTLTGGLGDDAIDVTGTTLTGSLTINGLAGNDTRIFSISLTPASQMN